MPALGAAPPLRRGAEIVAAVLAEADAILTAGVEDRAKPQRGERGEEQSEEPVGGDIHVGAERVWKVSEAEAEEMGGSAP